MWYEIIPSFTVITLAMAFPHYSAYVFNWLLVDNFFRRRIADKTEALEYLRNKRLTGSPYILCGLECLPEDKDANTVCICLKDDLITEKFVNPPKIDIPDRPKKKEETAEGEGDDKKKKKEGGGHKDEHIGHKDEQKVEKKAAEKKPDDKKEHKDEHKTEKKAAEKNSDDKKEENKEAK